MSIHPCKAAAKGHHIFAQYGLLRSPFHTCILCLSASCGLYSREIVLGLQGSAGQSFACFLVAGIKLRLVGEANDYVGKGMAGGEVVIVPPPGSKFKAEEASLVGNTCLYGATGGRLFVNGRAGELFGRMFCFSRRSTSMLHGSRQHRAPRFEGTATTSCFWHGMAQPTSCLCSH